MLKIVVFLIICWPLFAVGEIRFIIGQTFHIKWTFFIFMEQSCEITEHKCIFIRTYKWMWWKLPAFFRFVRIFSALRWQQGCMLDGWMEVGWFGHKKGDKSDCVYLFLAWYYIFSAFGAGIRCRCLFMTSIQTVQIGVKSVEIIQYNKSNQAE